MDATPTRQNYRAGDMISVPDFLRLLLEQEKGRTFFQTVVQQAATCPACSRLHETPAVPLLTLSFPDMLLHR